MIVMVSSLGDVWLTPQEAQAVAKAMKNNVTSMTLRGSIYTTRSVSGLLQPEAYKTMYITKKRSWTCQYGSGHAWNDNCSCRPSLAQDLDTKALSAKNDRTPEQELEDRRRSLAMSAWIRKFTGDWKNKDFLNAKVRDKFIRDFKMPVEKQ